MRDARLRHEVGARDLTCGQAAVPDSAQKEQVRARMRATIRRLLTRYGYPPDKQPAAIELVMQQAELVASEAT
jgi:hypothetical protein